MITCSDQQIFTGGAYAITLRYLRGCEISAYHYNIVTNILLLTRATHLMSVTISRHYWEHPIVALLRVIITAAVYLVTGIMLSNQGVGFPTEVPDVSTKDSPIFMQAACFQNTTSLLHIVDQTFNTADNARAAFINSQGGEQDPRMESIPGDDSFLPACSHSRRRPLHPTGDGSRREACSPVALGSRTCAPRFAPSWCSTASLVSTCLAA